MNKAFVVALRKIIIFPITLLTMGVCINKAYAQDNTPKNTIINSSNLYKPIPINGSTEISDKLSAQDIPTGQGGFARDYTVKLSKGDNLAIDLSSENFDTIITLLAPNGSTVAENDDGPDGTSNSLLFTRITETGNYIVRVRSFGETGVGKFQLKVTKLQAVK
ncbi:PPC domain-containing protein [Sphaerospermopsis aphanizomenoides BCCUSP55]|uniref:PPC domain-containing protein n=1 Tax=Sphaerospermopsis aphanizomenoides TaxID=459663 RepID=UPI001907201A|nr:PPC domain-containing protein [Sphaerospermopsis aphanizomenoides]MBK1990952.1 PPC domain-containing protein [Sphaerospermopsis aphanizomenoides BCCUSP55]